MANLTETSTFDAGVYQIETTDAVVGGPSGVTNTPLKNLANRTKYLKDHVDAIEEAYAPKASPTFTGTPAAPTPATGTNTTQVATTAFVSSQITASAAPLAHVGGTGTAHGVATSAVAGFMSATDKAKLDGISAGATSSTGTITSVGGTAPIVSSGGTAPVISITAASTTVAGSMSSADKTKLDGIVAGATNTPLSSSAPVDLGTASVGTSGNAARADHVHSHGAQGGGSLHSVATTASAGFMSASDKAKLDGVASGATSSSGTVTSVSGTGPITVTSGTTTPSISISAASTVAAGSMSAADKSKLDGIAAGAQVNTISSVDAATGTVVLANLASFGKSLSLNGYQKLPGGLIIQWLGGVTTAGGVINAAFPMTFPTGFLKAVVCEGSGSGWVAAGQDGVTVFSESDSTSSALRGYGGWVIEGGSVTLSANISFNAIAIGY